MVVLGIGEVFMEEPEIPEVPLDDLEHQVHELVRASESEELIASAGSCVKVIRAGMSDLQRKEKPDAWDVRLASSVLEMIVRFAAQKQRLDIDRQKLKLSEEWLQRKRGTGNQARGRQILKKLDRMMEAEVEPEA
jgi:hypothetical protein